MKENTDAVYVSDNSKEGVPFDLDYLKSLWKKKGGNLSRYHKKH